MKEGKKMMDILGGSNGAYSLIHKDRINVYYDFVSNVLVARIASMSFAESIAFGLLEHFGGRMVDHAFSSRFQGLSRMNRIFSYAVKSIPSLLITYVAMNALGVPMLFSMGLKLRLGSLPIKVILVSTTFIPIVKFISYVYGENDSNASFRYELF